MKMTALATCLFSGLLIFRLFARLPNDYHGLGLLSV